MNLFPESGGDRRAERLCNSLQGIPLEASPSDFARRPTPLLFLRSPALPGARHHLLYLRILALPEEGSRYRSNAFLQESAQTSVSTRYSYSGCAHCPWARPVFPVTVALPS